MREPNYKEAMHYSWEMVRDHKILWIFGLLSACLGQWGVSNLLGGLHLAGLNELAPDGGWLGLVQLLFSIGSVGTLPMLLVFWLLFISLALLIVSVFVAVVSRGALIAAVGHWFAKGGKIDSASVWHHGVKNFWKILFLSILTHVGEMALLFIAMAVFILSGNSSAGFVAQAFFGTFILAAGLMLEITIIFASGYVVIDGATIPSAVSRGWKLFSHHALVSLELGLILAFLSIMLVFFLLLCGFLVFIPALVIWGVALLVGSSALIAYGTIVAASLFIIILSVSAGIFSAFNTSAWMYLFVKMHRESYTGWLVSKAKKLFSK